MKTKPTLFSLEMKLLKFEYTPLNMVLWYTDILNPLLVLVIKMSKKGMELLFFLTGESNDSMFKIEIIFEFLKMIRLTKQNRYVINLSSVVYRLSSSVNSLSQICSWKHKNAFAKVGPSGDSIASPINLFINFSFQIEKVVW